MNMLKRAGLVALFGLAASLAQASEPIVGTWKTIDDETGQAKALVEISIAPNGELTGKITKLLLKPGAVCDKCEGDKKGKPITGMTIAWGFHKDGEDWTDGKMLKADDGKVYNGKMRVIENGSKLRVRGYIGPFYKTQIWERLS